MSHFSLNLLKFAVFFLLLNGGGMWFVLYRDHQTIQRLQQLDNAPAVKVEPTPTPRSFPSIESRLDVLESSQEAIQSRVNDLEDSQSKSKSTKTYTQSTSSKSPKEYTLYLGEGSTVSREWTTVQSTTISIDTSKYKGITAVYFESGLSIIGGEAYAQLIDAESGAILTSRALVSNTPNPVWKSIQINLESGNHMYVVQLRSSSGELATLSGARIRIMAE